MGNNNSRKDAGIVARPPPTQPRSFHNHEILPQRRAFLSGRPHTTFIGVAKYVRPIEPIIQPVRQLPPIERVVIETPHSYRLWEQNYYSKRVKPEEIEALNSRIKDNTDELQRHKELAEKHHLSTLRETNRFYTERKPSTTQQQISINSFMPINRALEAIKRHDEKYFAPEGKLPELTPNILHIIQEASRPDPQEELLAKIDDVEILRKDIQKLLRLNWLNDEIINAYMLLLVQRGKKSGHKKVYSFNTFFYPKLRENGYNSIRRWTRKVDIFSYDFLLVPIHLGNHWCLAFIDFTTRIISYYDSLGGYPNGCCDTLLDYLRDESKDKKKQDFDDENWRLVNSYSEGIPQQKNCSDCGVFACTYAEYLTRQAKLKFSQEQMPYFRKKMIYEIITQQILE